jgi:hypothetical protein
MVSMVKCDGIGTARGGLPGKASANDRESGHGLTRERTCADFYYGC